MSESEHPADKILGADWRPPRQVLMEQAWEKLDPQTRERFAELQRAGWKEVLRLDQLAGEPAEQAWVEYELVPPDPREGEPQRIDHWLLKLELDEENRAIAIVEEHEER